MQSPSSQRVNLFHTFDQQRLPIIDNLNKQQLQNYLQQSRLPSDCKTMLIGLMDRVELLEKKVEVWEDQHRDNPRKMKKLRRKARDVPKIYKCNVDNCERTYGTVTSLKNHRKIKHGIDLNSNLKQEVQST